MVMKNKKGREGKRKKREKKKKLEIYFLLIVYEINILKKVNLSVSFY
jgi:hypothetical protein